MIKAFMPDVRAVDPTLQSHLVARATSSGDNLSLADEAYGLA